MQKPIAAPSQFSNVEAQNWSQWAPDQMWTMPTAEVEAIQLAGLKTRFQDLAGRIPVLRKLASEQGIDAIRRLEDAAPLLFLHNVYKSYPQSIIEKGEFTRLTRWLDGLTAFDLSQIDASGVDGIDDWIDLLNSETEIRVIHSSGTTGKLSFLPRSRSEFEHCHLNWHRHFFEGFGSEGENHLEGFETAPVINPGFATGAAMGPRMVESVVDFWHRGNGTPVVSLYPERMSADALSLAGRIRIAEARGELGQLQLSEKLIARRREFMEVFKDTETRMERFIDEISRFQGERVFMIGVFSQYYDVVVAGNRRGLSNIFRPDSLISMGGGNKGRALPEGWQALLNTFIGRTVNDAYAMSEVIAGSRKCPGGHYHLQTWAIPYLIDPKSGQLLPREGTKTGRLGLFDLLPSSYWGGFLSGDEVTMTWDAPCACGRIGAYVHGSIRRYSEQEGGDDKITCAGAPEAHDRAVQYLIDIAG